MTSHTGRASDTPFVVYVAQSRATDAFIPAKTSKEKESKKGRIINQRKKHVRDKDFVQVEGGEEGGYMDIARSRTNPKKKDKIHSLPHSHSPRERKIRER